MPRPRARTSYPSDLTDAQWALVQAAMPPATNGRTGRPRTYPLREVCKGTSGGSESETTAVSMGRCTTGPAGSVRAGRVRRYPAPASSAKCSAGLRQPSVSRGRPLGSAAMASRAAWSSARRSAPLGRYCRRSPFVFSFVPRCGGRYAHGLRGSQM